MGEFSLVIACVGESFFVKDMVCCHGEEDYQPDTICTGNESFITNFDAAKVNILDPFQ